MKLDQNTDQINFPRGRAAKADDPLSELLASEALARVITHFVLHPDLSHHLRALRRHTGLGAASLAQALKRLEEWGVIVRRETGRRVAYTARTDHPRWRVLRSVVRHFATPTTVLEEAMADVGGVDAAFIYGSEARGDTHAESDVDLFVVGDSVDTRALAAQTVEAGILLDRDVSVTRLTWAELADKLRATGFVRTAVTGPKRWIKSTAVGRSALSACAAMCAH